MSRITLNTGGLSAAKLTKIRNALFLRLQSDTITQPSSITKTNIEDYLQAHLIDLVKGFDERENRRTFSPTPVDLS